VIVGDAGEDAIRRFLEFFAATIRNRNTRVAYYNAVRQFSPGASAGASTG